MAERPTRDDLGRQFCKGEGIEIGAGHWPTKVSRGASVHYVDKRTPEELVSYFSTEEVVHAQDLSDFHGRKFDFLMAHHVLEHSANVIQTLIDWTSLIRDGGILFLSLPNRHTTDDALRLLTPPTHFILDYINRVGEDDFESREHICSFLWSWIDVGGLQDTTKLEAAALVSKALNNSANDLHWHTFNIDTIEFVVKVAAKLAGRGIEVMFEQDGYPVQDEHRLVCKVIEGTDQMSEHLRKLVSLKETLSDDIYGATLEEMDGCAVYSLAKEHRGKIFLVDDGKLRWVRSPQTLNEKGLGNRDYTYLEIGGRGTNMLGSELVESAPVRNTTIEVRLSGREELPGIELSPGATPILAKDRFNVTYLDKFDHTKSTETYFGAPAVSIDFVLGDKLIDEVLEHQR